MDFMTTFPFETNMYKNGMWPYTGNLYNMAGQKVGLGAHLCRHHYLDCSE